ncbi:MAG: CPBP family intramembrane metalloprotease [bacterium]|nr:CPBP family intramembrane metalloprotease [bacterium]
MNIVNRSNPMDFDLKPLPLWQSALWFGIPGLTLIATINWGVPWLMEQGLSYFLAFTIALYGPMGLLIPVALIGMRLEGIRLTPRNVKRRLRFNGISIRGWLAIVVGFAFITLMEQLLSPVNDSLATLPGFRPSQWLPDFMQPGFTTTMPITEFMGQHLAGQTWVIPYMFVCLLLNAFGEAMLWRGLLLPRMELNYGRWAWVVNGLFWVFLFHAGFRHLYPALIPGCLIMPYLAQRTNSTWASLVIHFTGGLLIFMAIVTGI